MLGLRSYLISIPCAPYLTELKPLIINLLTNYMDVLYWSLTFAMQSRSAVPLSVEAHLPPHPSRVTIRRPALNISGSLNPFESTLPGRLLSNEPKPSVILLESALTTRFQLLENPSTLSSPESVLTERGAATPLVATHTKNTGGGGCAASFSTSTTMPDLSFHAFTATHLATLSFSISCGNGGSEYPSSYRTEVPLAAFFLRLLTAPSRTPLLSSTSHQSPVTSHQQ